MEFSFTKVIEVRLGNPSSIGNGELLKDFEDDGGLVKAFRSDSCDRSVQDGLDRVKPGGGATQNSNLDWMPRRCGEGEGSTVGRSPCGCGRCRRDEQQGLGTD